MGYLSLLASETLRWFLFCFVFFLPWEKAGGDQGLDLATGWMSISRRGPTCQVPYGQSGAATAKSKATAQGQDLTAGTWQAYVSALSKEASEGSLMFTLEIRAYQPAAPVCQAAGAHSRGNPRAVHPPVSSPLASPWLLEAESREEIPGSK